MRLRIPAAVAAAALLLPAVGGTVLPAAPADAGRTITVEVGTSYYAPVETAIKAGDRVRFRWSPSLDLHNVRVKTGPERFKSPTQAAGTWTRKFRKPGKFLLYCTEHEDMSMKLTVKKR
jgi:plastocyanin